MVDVNISNQSCMVCEEQRDIQCLEKGIMDKLEWKAEWQREKEKLEEKLEEVRKELSAIEDAVEVDRVESEKRKRRLSTRFWKMDAEDAVLIVMKENGTLHFEDAHQLIVDGGGTAKVGTIRMCLSKSSRYSNDWGTGCYTIRW